MNRLLILSIAGLTGMLIVAVQLLRRRKSPLFDAIDVMSWLYFVLFCVIPIYLQLADINQLHATGWRWIFRTPFADDAFVYASILALAGYPLILFGGRAAGACLTTVARVRRGPRGLVSDLTPNGDLMLVGGILLIVGAFALAIYMSSIGGPGPYFLQALLFRGAEPPVVSPFAFLKNVSYMLLGASYCFYALRRAEGPGGRSVLVATLFGVSLVLSLVHLYHAAGRLSLVAFVATFPLVGMIQGARWRWRTIIVLGALGVGVVLFGKQLFFPQEAARALSSRWEWAASDIAGAIRNILVEFSFPYVTLANVTIAVPLESPFRWFADLPLAVQYLVPQRLLGVTHAPMVTMINTDLLTDGTSGAIPVDLLSFGHYSAGIPGVVVVALALGFLLGVSEALFQGDKGAVFRVALALFLGFRVMYGDPSISLQAGFYLVVTARTNHGSRARPRC